MPQTEANDALSRLLTNLHEKIAKADFAVLKDNYNRYLVRDTHTRVIYEEDEDGYAATPFSLRELQGDDVYLRHELRRQLQISADDLRLAPFPDERKISVLLDEYAALVQGLAVTLGQNPAAFRKKLTADALRAPKR